MKTTAIDPKAGTHFTGKIFVTPHALDRATEYFGVKPGSERTNYVMDMLRKASLIDPCVIGEDGNSCRLFAYKRTALIVDLIDDTVVTIYPREEASLELRDGVEKVLARLLKAAQRTEARELKRLAIRKAELNVQRAELELRLLYANLPAIKRKINEEITNINAEMNAVDSAAYEVKREKSTLAKGICAFI